MNETSEEKTAQKSIKLEDPASIASNTTSFPTVSQQPIKKSLSSWDVSNALNRVLTSKSKNASSSTSELPTGAETNDQEAKKVKWYSKLGLSSSKSSLDGDRSEKKKTKWFKSNKKIATAM